MGGLVSLPGRAVASACVLLSATLPLAGETASRETRSWVETVETGTTVRVDNPYGNVYSRFGGYKNEVEIQATFQRLESDRPPLEVTLSPAEPGLDVRVGPAQGALETRDRADLVIFVPRGVRLDARTEDGLIEAKGLKGDLIASSIKGDILVRGIEGRVQAKTARGRISAVIESDAGGEPQSLTTQTGEIELHLWEDANFDVHIATSGIISTDFSLEIEHHRFEEPGKSATARVGRGGPRLTLSSKRGDVRLLQLQRDFKQQDKNAQGDS